MLKLGLTKSKQIEYTKKIIKEFLLEVYRGR